MSTEGTVWPAARAAQEYTPRSGFASALGAADQRADGSGDLGDILERVLDKGLVIAGDIRVNLLDIELLTIKLRLVVASVDTARQMGIDWWERDPWLVTNPASRQLDRGDGSSTVGKDSAAGAER